MESYGELATVSFVNKIIDLWNQKVDYFHPLKISGVSSPPQYKSIEGFHEWMVGREVITQDNNFYYKFSDVCEYLESQPTFPFSGYQILDESQDFELDDLDDDEFLLFFGNV